MPDRSRLLHVYPYCIMPSMPMARFGPAAAVGIRRPCFAHR